MRYIFLIGSLVLCTLLSIPPVYADSDSTIPDLTPREIRDTQKDLSDTTGAANQTHHDLLDLEKEPDYQDLHIDKDSTYEDAAGETHDTVAAGKEDAAKQTHGDVMKDAPHNYTDTSVANP